MDRNTILGVINTDEESREVTIGEFLELLNRVTGEESRAAEDVDLMKAILKAISKAAEEHPDIVDTEANAAAMAYFAGLLDDLETFEPTEASTAAQPTEEELRRIVEIFARDAFPVAPAPRGIDNILNIYQRGGFKKTITTKFRDGGKDITCKMIITSPFPITIREQKILHEILISFSEINFHGARENICLNIPIPLTRTMEYLGLKTSYGMKKQFSMKLQNEILTALSNINIQIVYSGGKGKDKRYDNIKTNLGGGTTKVSISDDLIWFKINPDFAQYINTRNLTRYHEKMLYLQNPTAFYICGKLLRHYFKDGNRQRGANNTLRIKTLLESCPDLIPSYEESEAADRGHWRRNIQDKLEGALAEIEAAGIFKCRYKYKGGDKALTSDKARMTYGEWSLLYIQFDLIPEEPDQTDRLEHKRARLEKAKEKRALKEAELMVKADAIQRKKERKAKKAAENG